MPEFTSEIDIDPSEFIDSCNKRELQRLVEILEEDGHIEPSQSNKSKGTGVSQPNSNDFTFWSSLDKLAKCRDLLTIEEEDYINKLASKFKHLR
jgi:hypothetical protein